MARTAPRRAARLVWEQGAEICRLRGMGRDVPAAEAGREAHGLVAQGYIGTVADAGRNSSGGLVRP
ncbi:MAG: hypothetical protein N2444_04325, partial [Methylocystis sp.]|nr:hypothetical protein [Methylocystis sp.]